MEPESPVRPAAAPSQPPAVGASGIDAPDELQPSNGPDAGATDETAELAKQEGQKVADDAREHVHEVADTAREGVAEVAEEAKHQAIDLAEDARQQLHTQARLQTDHLGEAIQDLGRKLHALADGRTDETGQVGDYADRVADRVGHIGDRMQELGFDGTVDELQRFARRRPGVFLIGAAAAGFAVSRLGRGAKDAQQDAQQDDGRSSAGERVSGQPSTPGRSLTTNRPHQEPARTGNPETAAQPSVPAPTPAPSSGEVPPPPPPVPAADPTIPRGRP